LAILIGCMAFGFLIGWNKLLPQNVLRLSSKLITIAILFLLVTMGLQIGLDRQTLYHLGKYGLQALFFALMTILWSLGAVAILEKAFTPKKETIAVGKMELKTDAEPHPYRMTLIMIGAFFVGVLLGFFIAPPWVKAMLPNLTNGALYVTLFAVGIDLGLNKKIWKQVMIIGPFVFLAPLGVAFGSVLAGMIVGKLLGWTVWEGGAVGAGFGWYSLSGVMISELHSAALGTISFLSNVIREIVAIMLTPLLVKRAGKFSLVAPGGATTMDTTLPILAMVGPPGTAVIAFINGVVLSTLVPILVPLLLGLNH